MKRCGLGARDAKRPEVGEEMQKIFAKTLKSAAYAEGFDDAVRRYETGME